MVEWSLVIVASFSALVGSCLALVVARINVTTLPGTELDVDSYLEIDGVSLVANRAVYEAHYLEFEMTIDEDAVVDVEFCEGANDFVFSRISYRFTPKLNLGVRLMTEHDDRVSNRVLQMREVNIEDDEFDDSFLVFCHDDQRVKRLFGGPVRTQLLDLGAKVTDLRLIDEGLAVSCRKVLKPDALQTLVRQVFDAAQSYESAAGSLDGSEESHEPLGDTEKVTGRGRENIHDGEVEV